VEQFSLGIIVGTLAVATPSIVGAVTPSFAPWLFAIVCYVGAALQVLGFMGVAQEKHILFRRYATLNVGVTIAAFAIAAAWVILSASRHSTALSNCESTFYPATSNGSNTSEGQTLCNIIAWVDVGLMAGAWVFFALVQAYTLIVISSYGSAQRLDHEKASADEENHHGHMRNESTASTVMNALQQKGHYVDGSSYLPPTYPPQHPSQPERQQSTRTAVSHPSNAYTQGANNHYGSGGPVEEPAPTKAHPSGY